MSEKIRQILQAVSADSAVLQQLRENPQELADKYDLSAADRERLERSDQLIAIVRNPFVESDTTTITLGTITITGTPPKVLPRTLEELSPERLIEVTKRILADPDYAARVRAFISH